MITLNSESIGAPYKWTDGKFAWRGVRKTWKNFGPVRYDARAEEGLLVLEDAGREVLYTIAFEEYAKLRTETGKTPHKNHEEGLELAEALTTNRRFFRAIVETALISEVVGKKLQRSFTDRLAVKAEERKTPQKNVVEQTRLQEALEKAYVKHEAETLAAAENLSKCPHKHKEDAIAVFEETSKAFAKDVAEAVLLAETLLKEVRYYREKTDSLRLKPEETKKLTKHLRDDIKIAEAYLRNANAVLSDLYYSNKPISFDEFRKLETPVGFAPFRDFVIGDYSYQEAIFRMILQGPVTSGRPLATDWTLNVDVPDISDRGTCTIPAAGARVKFAKRFYAAPEVHVAVRGGLGATPEYEVDVEGFTIKLRKADGTTVEGVISWQANGY